MFVEHNTNLPCQRLQFTSPQRYLSGHRKRIQNNVAINVMQCFLCVTLSMLSTSLFFDPVKCYSDV